MLIQMTVRGIALDPITNMPIIILKDVDERKALPIWVGIFEANAIALELEKVTTPRPMTHDLLKSVLDGLGVTVRQVIVNDLKDNTFFAVIELSTTARDQHRRAPERRHRPGPPGERAHLRDREGCVPGQERGDLRGEGRDGQVEGVAGESQTRGLRQVSDVTGRSKTRGYPAAGKVAGFFVVHTGTARARWWGACGHQGTPPRGKRLGALE